MVDKFVICIRYLVTLRYALSDKWRCDWVPLPFGDFVRSCIIKSKNEGR